MCVVSVSPFYMAVVPVSVGYLSEREGAPSAQLCANHPGLVMPRRSVVGCAGPVSLNRAGLN